VACGGWQRYLFSVVVSSEILGFCLKTDATSLNAPLGGEREVGSVGMWRGRGRKWEGGGEGVGGGFQGKSKDHYLVTCLIYASISRIDDCLLATSLVYVCCWYIVHGQLAAALLVRDIILMVLKYVEVELSFLGRWVFPLAP